MSEATSRVATFPPRTLAGRLFHLVGIALAVNSLDTYLFTAVFTRCSSAQLSPSCHGYGAFDGIVQALGDLIINLLLRFTAGIGFALDGLALAYPACLVVPALRRRMLGRSLAG